MPNKDVDALRIQLIPLANAKRQETAPADADKREIARKQEQPADAIKQSKLFY